MNPITDGIVGAVSSVVNNIITRVWPDPVEQARAQLALAKLQQDGVLAQLAADTDLAKGQLATNVEEAKSDNVFVSGWRPFIGWVCGSGFAIQFVAGPLLSWGSALYGHPVVFPTLDLNTMLPMLFGMLGLGAYRTYEKVKSAQ